MLTVIHKKFLTLWKDTDPGFSEVDDAKQRTGWVEVIVNLLK